MRSKKLGQSIGIRPLYRQLADLLRQGIAEGEFPDGRIPPEKYLTSTYSVSPSVVSWALNLLEKEGLINRVHRRGTFIKGRPQNETRALRPIIYVMLGPFTNERAWGNSTMYSRIVNSMYLKSEEGKCDVHVHSDAHEGTWRFNSMVDNPLLIGGLTFHHGRAKKLREAFPENSPIVSLDHCVELRDGDAAHTKGVYVASDSAQESLAEGVAYVATDNVQAGRDLTAHLIAKGHRKIAFVGGVGRGYPTHEERLGGYYAALAEAGLTAAQPKPISEDAVDEALWRKLRDQDVTAVLCYNDQQAVLALNQLNRQGIRVPEDISLACFDDNRPILRRLTPSITAMKMDLDKMASIAWNILTEEQNGEKWIAPTKPIRVPYTLSERDSVATINPASRG